MVNESDPFDVVVLPSLNLKFIMKDGIVRVLNQCGANEKTDFADLGMFLADFHFMINWVNDDLL